MPALSRRTLLAGAASPALAAACAAATPDLADLVRTSAEPLPPVDDEGFAAFADRYADARVVLLGESSHGTDEFYRARAAVTERLVRRHDFTVVALEADWPDAARMDAHVRGGSPLPSAHSPFHRFPAWMWRNQAVEDLLRRLRAINAGLAQDRKVGLYGLDLYSLPSSMDAVVEFARRHDPAALEEVRGLYGCLAPWADDPVTYGRLARSAAIDSCADEVAEVAGEVLRRRLDEIRASDREVFDALMNARVVAASEAYHRAMHEGGAASWNLRDTHMMDTLRAVLEARGPRSRAVVWAHNSHIGDARATAMGDMGEINLGQLAREEWDEGAVLVGFGTHAGTVTAASRWGGRAETMAVNPSMPGSWEEVMHAAGVPRFLLDLRSSPHRAALAAERLERFIGVIYRPATERWSHYVEARLSEQFDAFVWLDQTRAVEPLSGTELETLPQGHPFAA